MITCHRLTIEARCRQRGYAIAEVMPCVVSQDGDMWLVDDQHPAYPAEKNPDGSRQPVARDWRTKTHAFEFAARKRLSGERTQSPALPAESGPGTELKALLKDWLGIQASPNCSCNARARQMDEWGPDLCEQNLQTIVGWLEEQAKARKLPFVRFAAEQAVKLAIRRARKKAAR